MIIMRKLIIYITIILILSGLIILGSLNIKYLRYYQNSEYGNCEPITNPEIIKINFYLKKMRGTTIFYNNNKRLYDVDFNYPVHNPYFSLIYNKKFEKTKNYLTDYSFACYLNNNDNTTYYFNSNEYANQLRFVLGLIIFPTILIITLIIIYCRIERFSMVYNF